MVTKASVPAASVDTPVAPAQQPRPQVYASIAAIATALCKEGVGKNQTNKEQQFKFRGIDDLMAVLSPLLIVNKLVVLPRYSDRVMHEYTSKGGSRLASVTVTGTYRIVSLADGSFVDAGPFFGEGMDTGDKATAKAMSIAFKYFFIQTFVVPIVGNDDPDFESHEPVGVATEPQSAYPETETVEGAINRLAKTKPAREKLAALVAKAYGVVLPDQVPEDKIAEAIAKLEHYITAQKTAAKKKAA